MRLLEACLGRSDRHAWGFLTGCAVRSSTQATSDVPKCLGKHVSIFANGLRGESRLVRYGGGWVGGNC